MDVNIKLDFGVMHLGLASQDPMLTLPGVMHLSLASQAVSQNPTLPGPIPREHVSQNIDI